MFKYFENVFNDNKFNGFKNKYFVVSNALKSLNIKISGAKIYHEKYDDLIHADECTVEMRNTTIKTWHKGTHTNFF